MHSRLRLLAIAFLLLTALTLSVTLIIADLPLSLRALLPREAATSRAGLRMRRARTRLRPAAPDPRTGGQTAPVRRRAADPSGSSSSAESSARTIAAPVAVCGNGYVEKNEACDDGNVESGDGCSSSCTVDHGYVCESQPSVCRTRCGDGLIGGPERCDDGNRAAGDGCSESCGPEFGFACTGEPSACTLLSGNSSSSSS